MNKYVLFWYSKVIFKFQNENIKKYFRQLEITSKKLVTKELHLYFNENCVRDNLLPIYTNFKLHDAEAKNEKCIQNCRKQLIVRQINQQKEDIKVLKQQRQDEHSSLMNLLNSDYKQQAMALFLTRITRSLSETLPKASEKTF
jgi:oligoribonuclease NrnB/cAMP/cGMP phosphodiesterase (DHH superfamily)